MAKKFKAVFIMEDKEYKEITNEEHQLRKAEDEESDTFLLRPGSGKPHKRTQ